MQNVTVGTVVDRGVGDAGPGTDAGDAGDAGGMTWIVTNTRDEGPGSLRGALLQAAAQAGSTILFDIPNDDSGRHYYADDGGPDLTLTRQTVEAEATIADFDPDYPAGTARSWWRIETRSPLPPATGVIIDGASQARARGIQAAGPTVFIVASGSVSSALSLRGASVVTGLIVGGFEGFAIELQDAPGASVSGSHIGTDPSGTFGVPNGVGVVLRRASGAQLGDVADAGGMVVAGNATGILVDASPNATIAATLVGVQRGLHGSLGNTNEGVRVVDSSDVVIGGVQTGSPVTVADNGVGVLALRSDRLSLERVIFGTSLRGDAPSWGQRQDALRLEESGNATARECVFANSGGAGVFVQSGTANTFVPNAFIDNAGLDIDLAPTGANVNDALDADLGPNGLQNSPTSITFLQGAGSAGEDIVRVVFGSAPNTTYDVEVQYRIGLTPSGLPQFRTETGSVTTDGAGDATLDLAVVDVVSATVFEVSLTGPEGTGERLIVPR